MNMTKNKKLAISFTVVFLVSAMVYCADSIKRQKDADGKIFPAASVATDGWQTYENRALSFNFSYPEFLEPAGKTDCLSGEYHVPPENSDRIFYLRSKGDNSVWFYIQVANPEDTIFSGNTAFLGYPAEIKTIEGFDGRPENSESVISVRRNSYLYILQKTPPALSGATQKDIDAILSTFSFIN